MARMATAFIVLIAWLEMGPAVASAGDKYAVVVGVETYDTDQFFNLDYATEDAAGLAASLERLDFDVTLMTGDSRSAKLKPSSPAKIAGSIKAVVASCQAGDTLLISLSGHGLQYSDEPLLATGVRETYFCPGDASQDDKTTMLKVSQVVDFLRQCKATRKLLLVDACRNEVLSPNGTKKSSALRIDLGSVHENRRSIPGGLAVLFSCSSKQFSWEHDRLKHSVFSHHVIAYLNGKAESRYYDNNQLSITQMAAFVSKSTNDYVRNHRLSSDGQYPVMRGDTANWSLGNRTEPELVNGLGMRFRLIPAGSFLMGSPLSEEGRDDDEQQHRVEITKDFYLGTYEVTRGQFAQFVTATGYRTDAEKDGEGGWGWNSETEKFEGRDPKYSWKSTGFRQTDSHPVVNVSWNDATAFAKWLSTKENRVYRLPTEAEWEYACRGQTTTRYHCGDDAVGLATVGNVADSSAKAAWKKNYDQFSYVDGRDGFVFTAPVGKFKANRFGLHDMHGNVWEWCSDWYDADYYKTSPPKDPRGPTVGSSRLLRGGGWRGDAAVCRSADRYDVDPAYRSSYDGFRLVCE